MIRKFSCGNKLILYRYLNICFLGSTICHEKIPDPGFIYYCIEFATLLHIIYEGYKGYLGELSPSGPGVAGGSSGPACRINFSILCVFKIKYS